MKERTLDVKHWVSHSVKITSKNPEFPHTFMKSPEVGYCLIHRKFVAKCDSFFGTGETLNSAIAAWLIDQEAVR